MAIELELEAICGDTQFRSSQRNCEFLRYVVNATLEGRAAEIKERTLGTELFGRPAAYDTGSDAVVRVRANDVRKRLAQYYEEHTPHFGWRIQVPSRTYVPVFLRETRSVEPDRTPVASDAPIASEERAAPRRMLTLRQMMMPTLVALFLCSATFRWQIFSGSPYLDFWESLLSGRPALTLVLDADSTDPHAITVSDLQAAEPLLQTVASFHATTTIQSSADSLPARAATVSIYITHHPRPHGPSLPDDPSAAYVTVVPGQHPEVWVSSINPTMLKMAIGVMSSSNTFPHALAVALRRTTASRIRIADQQPVTVETAATESEAWPH